MRLVEKSALSRGDPSEAHRGFCEARRGNVKPHRKDALCEDVIGGGGQVEDREDDPEVYHRLQKPTILTNEPFPTTRGISPMDHCHEAVKKERCACAYPIFFGFFFLSI